MTPPQVFGLVLVAAAGFGLAVAVIRVAVAPVLAELRALRDDLASGLGARRSSEEVPAP